MDRHAVVHTLYISKAGLGHQPHQLFRRSQAARAHGQKIKMKVSVCLRCTRIELRAGLRHRLSQEQHAARGKCCVNLLQQLLDDLVRVVMGYAHQGHQIGALRQGIVKKIAGVQACSIAQTFGLEIGARQLQDRRQIK